jgi:putative transposase
MAKFARERPTRPLQLAQRSNGGNGGNLIDRAGFHGSGFGRGVCSERGVARPLRLHVPGMLYHVMSRGNAKQVIFTDDRDYERYLHLLERGLQRFRIKCLAYCLLGNHLHLLLKPDLHPVSRLMHQVNSAYCQWFNRRHRRVGHVLQGRYKALLVETAVYLQKLVRYIAMNPVAAGRVRHPARWRWSSYRATAGIDPCPAFLQADEALQPFDAGDRSAARERFAAYVAGTADGSIPERALILGSDAFARSFQPLLYRQRDIEAHVLAERFAARPPLSSILGDAPQRSRTIESVRAAFLHHAYTLREIGKHIGRSAATVWFWVHRAEPVAPGGEKPGPPTAPEVHRHSREPPSTG